MAFVSQAIFYNLSAFHQRSNEKKKRHNTHLPLFLNPTLHLKQNPYAAIPQFIQKTQHHLSFSCKTTNSNLSNSEFSKHITELKRLCEIENIDASLQLNTFAYNSLLSSYIKQGKLEDAHHLFDKMPERNTVSWSSIISANTRSGNFFHAFDMFEEMMEEGLIPNEYTLGSLLKASSGLGDIWVGKQLHGWSIRTGFASHAGVRTSLITMYSNCKFLDDAMRIFCDVPPHLQEDIPTWNSIIAANVSNGDCSEGFQLFSDMLCTGLVRPTKPTYASMLNAYASVGAIEYGRIIHGKIRQRWTVQQGNYGEFSC